MLPAGRPPERTFRRFFSFICLNLELLGRFPLDYRHKAVYANHNKLFQGALFMAKEKTQTPGAALQTFMDDYQVTPAALAKIIGMSQSGVRQIAIGQTGITVPVALRLAKYFGTTPDFWINLQTVKSLSDAAKDPELSAILKTIPKAVKPAPAKKTAAAPAKKTAAKKR
jgi:addiction module HigA family antidote